MGLCQSEEDKALAKKNQAINRELQEAYFENVKVIKLLLLGHNTYDDEIAYIEKKFLILNANTNKKVYIHHTCATDTNQVNLIMDNVVDSIIKKNLKGIGY
uniref:Uncharacterized protein n=1 Tax=Acrobeloides nanus TaxID=290746 RepID=A0A914CHC1_9BILA